MSQKEIVKKGYSGYAAFVQVKVAVLNPHNGQYVSFDEKCLVDTGFYGGVALPEVHLSDIRLVGIEPSRTNVGLAGGAEVSGYVCHAFLEKIERYGFPKPGIETELLLLGKSPGGLGMGILNNWASEFDGPERILSIYEKSRK